MSQVAHPTVTVRTRFQVVSVALLALAAVAVVALVIALSGPGSSEATNLGTANPYRSGPDESRVAASISGASNDPSHPDESRTAAAIAGR